jgi:hypothetical protein
LLQSYLFPNDFLKTKNTTGAELLRIVFAVAVSIGDLQSLIAHLKGNLKSIEPCHAELVSAS